jgi:ectoine hydroxylase-related dioxygenase (phytanoyl-CoA dioxygenase family)
LDQYGFVIIRDVLSQEDVTNTVDDVWSYLESGKWRNCYFRTRSEAKGPSRDLPTQWDKVWPSMQEEGILGSPPVFTKQAFKNRQNPRVYQVFSSLLKQEKLMVNIDRYGLFRPTKKVNLFGDGSVIQDRPSWKTINNLHLDMNAWDFYNDDQVTEFNYKLAFPAKLNYLPMFCSEYNQTGHHATSGNELRLQGLINLVDNREQDGGFQLVPGFHKYLKEWAEHTKGTIGRTRSTFVMLPGSEPMHRYSERITMPAGALLVWDIRLPHGSRPNESERERLAQFIKYFPAPPKGVLSEMRTEILKEKIEESDIGEELTDLGKKLFGLADWE